MKADDIDPSANNSRSKLGIRYATKKASAAAVAPNRLASTMSRINPRMRLAKVAAPITPAALTTERVSSCAFVEAGDTTVGSGMNLDSSGTTPGSLSSERFRDDFSINVASSSLRQCLENALYTTLLVFDKLVLPDPDDLPS